MLFYYIINKSETSSHQKQITRTTADGPHSYVSVHSAECVQQRPDINVRPELAYIVASRRCTSVSLDRNAVLLPPGKLSGKLRFSIGIVFSCVCMLLLFLFFVSEIPQFFTRNIQDTSTKLSGIICRPPEQIKFDYHDSNSLPVALRMG